MLHRALIRTHHIISPKKIHSIGKLAKNLSCAIVLKTGRPPGIILAECEGRDESHEVDEKGEENGKTRVAGEGEERLRECASSMKVCAT